MVLIRGGGDLASGVALRLHRCGIKVLITELPEPLVIRRLVSFAEAVHTGEVVVEDVTGQLISTLDELNPVFENRRIPVLVDPELRCLQDLQPQVVVDARMRKKPPRTKKEIATLTVGLGPGFTAGENCHAAIETNRGHNLGRVLWEGSPEPDTGRPGTVMGYSKERVLRSPADGILINQAEIGQLVDRGQIIAAVKDQAITAPFQGAVRGLLRNETTVHAGMKVGDVDPRGDPSYALIVSDKARCLGGAVLEAILSRSGLREAIWT